MPSPRQATRLGKQGQPANPTCHPTRHPIWHSNWQPTWVTKPVCESCTMVPVVPCHHLPIFIKAGDTLGKTAPTRQPNLSPNLAPNLAPNWQPKWVAKPVCECCPMVPCHHLGKRHAWEKGSMPTNQSVVGVGTQLTHLTHPKKSTKRCANHVGRGWAMLGQTGPGWARPGQVGPDRASLGQTGLGWVGHMGY